MSTTDTHHRNETRIVADPDLPTILIIREFDAPPERVCRAYTDPDLVVRWLGPPPAHDADRPVRRAQRWLLSLRASRRRRNRVRLPRCVPRGAPQRAQTFAYEGFPDGVSLEATVFEELGGRIRVTGKSLMDSIEARDSMLRSGMDDGVREGHERLEELLGGQHSNSVDHTETGS